MGLTNQEVVEQLQQAVSGLRFASESDFPFEVFLWDQPTIETPRELLKQLGRPSETPLERVELDDFFAEAVTEQDWQTAAEREAARQYRRLVATINLVLSQVQIYRVGTIQIEVYIVGKTPTNTYAGLVTRVVET